MTKEDLEKIAEIPAQKSTDGKTLQELIRIAKEHDSGVCPKTKQPYQITTVAPRKGLDDTKPGIYCKSCGAPLGIPREDYSK